jgi:hypothetical protein
MIPLKSRRHFVTLKAPKYLSATDVSFDFFLFELLVWRFLRFCLGTLHILFRVSLCGYFWWWTDPSPAKFYTQRYAV